MGYERAAVCLNRHEINFSGKTTDKYCTECGSAVITSCPNCSTPIHGADDAPGILLPSLHYSVPKYCHNCGKPYPWTQTAINAAADVINEDDTLSESDKSNLISSLPDVIAETPKSNLASVRMKKALSAAGKLTADALSRFVVEFGYDLVKHYLGL